jgi:hypothetical protein
VAPHKALTSFDASKFLVLTSSDATKSSFPDHQNDVNHYH